MKQFRVSDFDWTKKEVQDKFPHLMGVKLETPEDYFKVFVEMANEKLMEWENESVFERMAEAQRETVPT